MSTKENLLHPLHVFNFEVDFYDDPLDYVDNPKDKQKKGKHLPLCGGAFSECTGLEATMEPKVIKEGGRNFGAAQRAGGVTFATVILKRGMTRNRDLWNLFEAFTANGLYAPRVAAFIMLKDGNRKTVMTWKLINAMPVKFKTADFNAKATEVGIEELHLAHEGIKLVQG